MGDHYRIVPPLTVKPAWPRYVLKDKAVVRAFQVDRAFDIEYLDRRLQGVAGDYLCIEPRGRVWVMDAETFEAVFQREED
jgi:hypothetical protein